MDNLPDICVMLSSYNGGEFIREQVDSILAQKNVNVKLLIRDDGSTDNTISILQEYQKCCDNITLILGENIGWKNSFMQLIMLAPDADYYSFADQDDVWMQNKLLWAVNEISKEVNETIVLYGSNVWVTDSNLNVIGTYCHKNFDFQNRPLIQKYDLCCMPGGLTYVFTPELKKLMKKWCPSGDFGHDAICYFLALSFGKIIYDQRPSVLYRQHGNNQIGAPGNFAWWFNKKLNTLFGPCIPFKSYWAKKIKKIYPEIEEKAEKLEILNLFEAYPISLRVKFRLIFRSDLYRRNIIDTIMLYMKILMNKW